VSIGNLDHLDILRQPKLTLYIIEDMLPECGRCNLKWDILQKSSSKYTKTCIVCAEATSPYIDAVHLINIDNMQKA